MNYSKGWVDEIINQNNERGFLLEEAKVEIERLRAALQPFADQARHLREWNGGPPMPAHAFRDEIFAAEEALKA